MQSMRDTLNSNLFSECNQGFQMKIKQQEEIVKQAGHIWLTIKADMCRKLVKWVTHSRSTEVGRWPQLILKSVCVKVYYLFKTCCLQKKSLCCKILFIPLVFVTLQHNVWLVNLSVIKMNQLLFNTPIMQVQIKVSISITFQFLQ